jgi:hypothetical protein
VRRGYNNADFAPEPAAMKSLTEYLTLTVPGKMSFVNITPKVAEAVTRSGVREGIVLVNRKRRSVPEALTSGR